MLGHLVSFMEWSAKRGEPINPERLRLFACACCRRVWHLLDEPHRRSVEILERHARAPDRSLIQEARRVNAGSARRIAEEWKALGYPPRKPLQAHQVANEAVFERTWASQTVRTAANKPRAAAQNFHDAAKAVGRTPAAVARELRVQAAILRDIFGNPFRPVKLDPAWLAWDGGTVKRLAQAIEATQDFGRLAVLSDALEEAGCTDEAILSHLRSPGPHVRGCWVVDLVLGKS